MTAVSGPQCVQHHFTVCLAGVVSGSGRVPAEERRLAAEEGSLSLNTWLRKTQIRGWVSSSTGPQPRVCPPPYCRVSTVCLTSHSLPTRTGMVGGWYLWIL